MTGIKNIKPGLRAAFAIAVLAAAVAIPAQAAVAQQSCANAGSDPTAAQYCSVSGVDASHNGGQDNAAQNNGTSGTTAPVADVTPAATTAVESSSSGSLPFTGLDVGILALVAVGLAGAGLLLRRLTASGVPRT